eukprot:TRINITY_DN58264_c0_g1_i1.p2 TRINITY_DN58264_c0_g1~~TRINITY_DN58264_c0_g1_i1.p2  ORF type:complete len:147 (-),score=14.69 TRINITY_DN58264_c0_g1_i1:27-467(-)
MLQFLLNQNPEGFQHCLIRVGKNQQEGDEAPYPFQSLPLGGMQITNWAILCPQIQDNLQIIVFSKYKTNPRRYLISLHNIKITPEGIFQVIKSLSGKSSRSPPQNQNPLGGREQCNCKAQVGKSKRFTLLFHFSFPSGINCFATGL